MLFDLDLKKVGPYAKWLLKPPRVRDLFSYSGIWLVIADVSGTLYSDLFLFFFASNVARSFAALTSVLLLALLFKRLRVFTRPAVLIAIGMTIVAANWTLDLGLPAEDGGHLMALGLALSLPLYCRCMETRFP